MKIITQDNSETFFNKKFNESYKSNTGAVQEAFEKFAKPAFEFVKNKKEINVLDFCFGLGYTTSAFLDLANCKISVTGIDNDDNIFDLIKQVNPEFKKYKLIKKLNKNNLTVFEGNIHIKIILDDAVKVIDSLPENFFDVVLFDPFSPKACPELWTGEVFKRIFALMKSGSILTTYSCARVVRENLKMAGFIVKDGPLVGRRGPSTIAEKK
ncbi:hypothetical protein HZA97_02605 [Candidatus Woesearchaeota archaeon]|nr:hypothetical protein [Candidatus Woesearchaeota archaeon]